MKRISYFLILCMAAGLMSFAQTTVEWSSEYILGDAFDYDAQSRDVAVDDDGNVYVLGVAWFSDSQRDYTLKKYDPQGNVLWYKRFDNNGRNDWPWSMDLGIGHVFITGYSGNFGSMETWTLHVDNNGNLRNWWFERGGDARSHKVQVGERNTYIMGTRNPYDPVNGKTILAKYDNFFSYANWSYDIDQFAADFVLDADENLILAGTASSEENYREIKVAKYDTDANLLWERTWHSGYGAGASVVALDDEGNIYVTGFRHILEVPTSDVDDTNDKMAVTLKYDSEGNLLWSHEFDSTDPGQEGANDSGNGIVVHDDGSVYVSVYVSERGDHTPYAKLLKYDACGNFLWERDAGALTTGRLMMRGDELIISGNSYANLERRMAAWKYDACGNQLWEFIDPSHDKAYSVKIAPAGDGDLIFTGVNKVWNVANTDIVYRLNQDASTPPACAPEGCNAPVEVTAVEAAGDVTVVGGAVVDSYNSCDGPYGGPNVGDQGNISAGGDVTVFDNAVITGSVNPNTPATTMLPEPPAGLNSWGNLDLIQDRLMNPGDYMWDHITIRGNVSLIAKSGGTMRIWYKSLTVQSNASIEPQDGLPSSIQLIARDGGSFVDMQSNSLVIGQIIAPNLPVTIGSNAHLYGSVSGDSVYLNANAYVHFDEALNGGCPEPDPNGSNVPETLNAVEATNGSIEVRDNAIVDSYSSCNGAYGGANTGSNGNLQASGSLNLFSNAVANGSASANTVSSASPVAVPEGLPNFGDLNLNSLRYFQAGNYLYNNINITNGAEVIGKNGLVKIFYKGTLTINGNVIIRGEGNKPGNLYFLGDSHNQMNIQSGANIKAVIYAPNQNMTIQSNAYIYGALVGQAVTVMGNAQIHYDEALNGGCN